MACLGWATSSSPRKVAVREPTEGLYHLTTVGSQPAGTVDGCGHNSAVGGQGLEHWALVGMFIAPPLICFDSPSVKSLTVSLLSFRLPTLTLPLFSPPLSCLL